MRRSKSYCPYDEEYLKLCRSATHVTAEDIRQWPFIVATKENVVCGFSAVCEVQSEKMLDHLWIDPPYIGQGLGRILFGEGVANAKGLGWNGFTIAADPYAEEFYRKMGAMRIGERESKIKKGFKLLEACMSFDAIGIVSENPARSVAFFKILGVDIQQYENSGHYEGQTPSGVRIMLDTVEVIRTMNPHWQKSTGNGIVLCFKQSSAQKVDEVYKNIVGAGFTGIKAPWDAFWGQRYACVSDPDGNQVDLFAAL